MAANGNSYKGMAKRMLAQGATIEQIQRAIDGQANGVEEVRVNKSDYVEIRSSKGVIAHFIEQNDGWWMLEGSSEGWKLSEDPIHGFLTSFVPPEGPEIALGFDLVTARGRHLVVASIRQTSDRLMLILMPR